MVLQAELDAVDSAAPSVIPFSRNELFVGRESQLAELETMLFSDQENTTRLAIAGPGGTGKSQLALETAHRTRLKNKGCSVFWMDASDDDNLSRSLAVVARKLRIAGCGDDQADMKQVVRRCVAAINARPCLLIFDNVEGTGVSRKGLSTGEAAALAEFLPHSKLCSVIFTTTDSDTAEALAPQNVVALRELAPATALRMLQNHLTWSLSESEQQDAMCLLRELSYLPLAVSQAAACMNASSMTVQQYQAQLDEHKEAASKYSNASSEGARQEFGLSNTVAVTLSVSLSQVCQRNAVAAEYLNFVACVDRKDISLDILEAVSPQVREDAVEVLDQYALVIRRPAESALDVHRLVHYALRKRLLVEQKLQQWIQRTITRLLWVFPSDNYSNKSKQRRLLPHAQYVLSHSKGNDDEERTTLAEKCATALYNDGKYKEAKGLWGQVMELRRRVVGQEHPSTLTSMNNLARALDQQGKYEEAETMHRQALAMYKKVLGREHPNTLTSMSNLANVLES
ncbi:hypothetical protein SLS59_007082 [Nothophoma quercina]|uniref:AAA+ ATPase domain-containing protein n=1 Tax=Nothophoma quercina TaxID=749835 RepID=A0ABR3R117_9PLEO